MLEPGVGELGGSLARSISLATAAYEDTRNNTEALACLPLSTCGRERPRWMAVEAL